MGVFSIVLLILGGLILVGGIVGFVIGRKGGGGFGGFVTGIVGLGIVILGLIFLFFNSFYTQDVGESVLQKDFTGKIVGTTTDSGWHWKSPLVDTTAFNIRNQPAKFIGDGKSDNAGGVADGPHITTQDADGVTVDLDVAIRYSIQADKVKKVYAAFKTEDNFKTSYIYQALRSATRQAPNGYKTLAVLTKRSKVETTLGEKLEAILAKDDYGVQIDSVSLQDARYKDDVTQAYAEAQKAQIAVSQAQANLEKQKVEAQQTVQQAQAQADANEILNQHPLNNQALTQKYIDQIGKGTTFVVPSGSTPFISVNPQG